jgi:hypothetical protein
MTQLTRQACDSFAEMRHQDGADQEFWYARELMLLLGYLKWERFLGAIAKAIESASDWGIRTDNHFAFFKRNTQGRPQEDYRLSAIATLLIIFECDNRKESVREAKLFFLSKLLQDSSGSQVGDLFTGWSPPSGAVADKSGFVYLVQQASTSYFKIGKTKTPYKRMQKLQTGCPTELVIRERIFSLNCQKLETSLHEHYSRCWVRGEWFNMSEQDVATFIQVANSLDDA